MDLTKLFVLVETAKCDEFITAHKDKGTSDSFYKKVAFLQKTGEIMTAGQIFGAASVITATELANIKTALEGYLTGAEASNVAAAIKAVTDDLGTANTATEGQSSNATGLHADVEANTAAIAILNSGSTVEGSVDKKVADAIAGVVASAPEAFDTLKEIADWIANDKGEDSKAMTAAQIITKVEANTTAIGTANTAAEGQPSNATGLYAAIEAAAHTKTTVTDGDTDGTIKVDGTSITVVDNASTLVHDENYAHITVTATSVSDGTTTFSQYTHPTSTAADAAAIKVGRDADGHVVVGNALTAADIATTAISGTDTVVANNGTTVSAQITNIQTELKTIEALDVWETYAGETQA